MNQEVLGWICAIISVAGNFLVNYKNRLGMILWIISNVLWIIYYTIHKVDYPQVFMYLVFTGINVHGIYKWTKTKGT